jgi:hypothetical protein
MDLNDLLRQMLTGTPTEKTKRVQVATLKSEDIIRCKTLEQNHQRAIGERDILVAKLHKLKADLELASKEWWEHVQNTYCLPRNVGEYHIEDQGRVMLDPKEKPSDE